MELKCLIKAEIKLMLTKAIVSYMTHIQVE